MSSRNRAVLAAIVIIAAVAALGSSPARQCGMECISLEHIAPAAAHRP